jgi:hypothetical protein
VFGAGATLTVVACEVNAAVRGRKALPFAGAADRVQAHIAPDAGQQPRGWTLGRFDPTFQRQTNSRKHSTAASRKRVREETS